MIAWLKGELMVKQPPLIVLNVNGVGYELEAPMTSFYDLPEVGDSVSLHVHLVVREDAQLLFGFVAQSQRDLFRNLIKINGVGPKVALAVLSTLTLEELLHCVTSADVTQLTRVPGIGKKTAERLLVDLKSRLEPMLEQMEAGQLAGGNGDMSVSQRADAIAALESLGYKRVEVSKVLRDLPTDLSSEEQIKQALRILSGKVL